jgi:ABC-type polysaccharide/polyol phosphate transport system ATPase subunit
MSISISAGAINAERVTLEYPLYKNIVLDRLRAILSPIIPALSPPVKRAVDEVSFSINPGELVGIVGVNGAGKTSLLKIVSGLVKPTHGRVSVGGRILALLAMGVGFRPNLTGRENLFYAGLLFRLRPNEIRAVLPSVEEFSELGPALDQPYFTYSSGMRARLAFSLATHVPADVIILDETLATGDAQFAAKCYGRIRELHGSGRTILFVSHNLGEVSRLCDRVIILHKGGLLFDGATQEGLRRYEHRITSEQIASPGQEMVSADTQVRLEMLGPDGSPTLRAMIGAPATIRMTVRQRKPIGDAFPFLKLYRENDNHFVAYLHPDRNAIAAEAEAELVNVTFGRGETVLEWRFASWPFGEGTYRIDGQIGPACTWRSMNHDAGLKWHNLLQFASAYENLNLKGSSALFEPSTVFSVNRRSSDTHADAQHEITNSEGH